MGSHNGNITKGSYDFHNDNTWGSERVPVAATRQSEINQAQPYCYSQNSCHKSLSYFNTKKDLKP